MNGAPPDLARRRLVRGLGVSCIAGATPLMVGCASMRGHLGGYDDVMQLLDHFASVALVSSHGAWQPSIIFAHCAQSIEYSLNGFPELKSELFRSTVGAAAAAAFAAAGQMRHNLAEPIPGAAPIADVADYLPALARLKSAFETFHAHRGPLQPHFAYGALEHADYEFAHVLHLDNHLDELAPLPAFLAKGRPA